MICLNRAFVAENLAHFSLRKSQRGSPERNPNLIAFTLTMFTNAAEYSYLLQFEILRLVPRLPTICDLFGELLVGDEVDHHLEYLLLLFLDRKAEVFELHLKV
jgi:hypothetical protein